MKLSIPVVLLALSAILPFDAKPAEPLAKLTLFQRAQDLCKATALVSADLAQNIVLSGAGSLSSICECAALLTVSQLSPEDAGLVSTSKEKQTEFQQSLNANVVRCIRVAPSH